MEKYHGILQNIYFSYAFVITLLISKVKAELLLLDHLESSSNWELRGPSRFTCSMQHLF